GKTTLMKTAIGFLEPWRGAIEFGGIDLSRRAPHEIARLGVGFVPENRRIFPGLTVRENLELGLSAAADRSAAARRRRFDEVFPHFPRLSERIEQPGKTLSGGEQQMLAIARVMMAGARLILMDEPTQGLAPAFIRHIRDMIAELKRLGVTVLLVEQNARVALSVCDRGYIMEKGSIVFAASSHELRESPGTREKLGVWRVVRGGPAPGAGPGGPGHRRPGRGPLVPAGAPTGGGGWPSWRRYAPSRSLREGGRRRAQGRPAGARLHPRHARRRDGLAGGPPRT